jgi:DNA-binding response OmpR family regulator
MEQTKILVADDDKNICQLIELYLGFEGYKIFFANDGSSAISMFKEHLPDLVLLDVTMPMINGWEVCMLIRKISNVPVIMVTSKDMVEDKVHGFEIGADDYIVKPFEPRELVARVKARLKGNVEKVSSVKQKGVIHIGNFVIDMNKFEVTRDGVKIEMKPKETQLLYFLINNKNIVFSREQLLEKVWDYSFMGDTRTVDVHVKRLREKIEVKNSQLSIKTIWGVGYKLEVKDA